MEREMFRLSVRRLVFAVVAMAIGMGAQAVQAQEVRYFAPQSTGLFEVIEGSGAGGRFVRQNRGSLLGTAIVGYTDRVQRGEKVVVFFGGSGVADCVGFTSAGPFRGQWNSVALPQCMTIGVSTNPADDNIQGFVQQRGKRVQKRLPIGKR
jgi:hypothetical protein